MTITGTRALSKVPYSKVARSGSNSGTGLVQKIRLELHEELQAARGDWQALEADVSCSPFQTFAWSHAWRSHVEHAAGLRPLIVAGRDETGRVQMILPLALRKQGPLTILEWLAGDHATYTGGLFERSLLDSLDQSRFHHLWSKIIDQLPPFDIARFMTQVPLVDGQVNPTAQLGSRENASPYFCITLDADWDSFHRERRSRTTRRSERRRERQLGELGVLKFDAHYQGPLLEQATEVIFSQRSARFAEQGIRDFLGDPGMADFYRALTKMTTKTHGIEGFVSTLRVGDTIAAGLLNIIHKNKNYALVSSMTTDEELRKPSPGEILMRNTLKHCCEKGLEAYDCGGGYDIYKDSWSDIKFHTLDTVLPRSMLGFAYAGSYNGFLAAKSHIKQSPALWKAFKTFRKLGFWS